MGNLLPAAAICDPAPPAARQPGSQRKTGKRGKNCQNLTFCQLVPIGEPVRFPFFLTSDTTDLPSDGLQSYTRAEASLPLASPEPRQSKREQSRTNSTAHGLQLLGADSRHKRFACHWTAPNQDKRAALRRVSDLPGGARLNHLLNRSTHHETVVHLLRSRRSIRCSVRANCYRVAPTELHSQRHSGIRPGGALKWH